MTEEEKNLLEGYVVFHDSIKLGKEVPLKEGLFVMSRAITILAKQALENQVTLEEIKTTVRHT